jgi:predicted RNA-binding Zn-ribbon protein involved in translation (DUF1610 family)
MNEFDEMRGRRRMSTDTYFPPRFGKYDFHCPHCGVYAQQHWRDISNDHTNINYYSIYFDDERATYILEQSEEPGSTEHVVSISKCGRCRKHSLWRNGTLIYPASLTVMPPNPDMPAPIQTLYEEARSIADRSPRAAIALLRLALEQLLPLLGAKKGKIDNMIAELVASGLNVSVQKALDSIRVIGNEAVHPGMIDLDDNPDTAQALFKILNFIIEKTITEKNEVDGIYELIPASKRKYIEEVRPVRNK